MDAVAHSPDSIPAHQGEWSRPVQGCLEPSHCVARPVPDRKSHLSVREGQGIVRTAVVHKTGCPRRRGPSARPDRETIWSGRAPTFILSTWSALRGRREVIINRSRHRSETPRKTDTDWLH